MALAVIARTVGRDVAEQAARIMEYEWHQDATRDPYARLYGPSGRSSRCRPIPVCSRSLRLTELGAAPV